MDDMAGHAYVEQFGQETFQRADNAMSASKASRYTQMLDVSSQGLILSSDRQQIHSKPRLRF